MFRETKHSTTEAVIELIRTLPEKEQKVIVRTFTSVKSKPKRKTSSVRTEQDVLNSIKGSLKQIKEAKRTGKPLKTLDEFLNEL